jgi:hypothetical protein
MKTRFIQQLYHRSGILTGLAFLMIILAMSVDAVAQERNKRQQESMLTARKWVVVNVSRKKLTKLKKMDGFRMEEGNEMSFSIDHKFGYKNNDYEYMSGKWILDKKEILLIHDARDMTNRLENSRFKIKKLSSTELILKRLDNPKGVLRFK